MANVSPACADYDSMLSRMRKEFDVKDYKYDENYFDDEIILNDEYDERSIILFYNICNEEGGIFDENGLDLIDGEICMFYK